MWWCMALIVTAMYTANLAAFFTVSRMDSGIQSIAELIAQVRGGARKQLNEMHK